MKISYTLILSTLSLILLASCTVEKTLTLRPDGATGKDAVVSSCGVCGYNTRNYGAVTEFTAIATTNMGSTSNARSLIQFDLSSIPAKATVLEAKLSFYHFVSPGNGEHRGQNDARLVKVIAHWEENTITWENQPATSEEGAVVLAESANNVQDYTDINVTSLVQQMVSNSEKNYGFMLRLNKETRYRNMIFASSDNENEAIRPMLVVKYKGKK